jgi:DNA-binding GntR family transcriptional regulator
MGVYRRDRRPLYQQIADDLRSQITTGRYRPSDPLPSLAELCQRYKVSPVTASSALAVLDQQQLIAVRHGLRSRVLTPPTHQDQDDLAEICRQVSVMVGRQEQIVHQVLSLQQTLGRLRQQVHQLRQQVHQFRR